MARFSSPVSSAEKGSIRSLKFLGRYLRPYLRSVIGALIALLFTSSAVLGMGGALRYLVDEGLGKGNHALLNQAFAVLMGVTVLLAVASYCRFYLVSSVGERVVADIRRAIYAHIVRMDVSFFEITRSGDLLSRLTTDTTLLQTVVGSSVSVALRNLLTLIGGLILLAVTSLKLTSYVLFILPVVVLPILLLGRKVRGLSRDSQDRVADVSACAEETIYGIRTLQALSLETHEQAQFNAQVEKSLAVALQRVRTRAWLTAIVIGLVFGAVMTVLWVGGHDVLAGAITPGQLSSFVFYSVIVAGAVGAISEVIGDLQRAAGATERMTELLATRAGITAPEHPASLPHPVTGALSFDRVTFHYPARPDKPALEELSLEIMPGETVALVGPSGAGKTTCFQLLLRFYDPAHGRITLDGIDIRTLDPQALRHQIGLVPQDPVIFSGTAWENIRYGRTDASDDEVIAAARAAAALDFLEKLPEGLATHLGEKGVRLSGGQRQRIAIARAIIRNPRILLLDEATSALDAQNERDVQEAIESLMGSRTTLVIAHRLATVLKADRIVVMDQGRIQAIGTHSELLSRNPLYRRLAELQFTAG